LRERYEEFVEVRASILALAPVGLEELSKQVLGLPFPCLADPQRAVFKQYGVLSRALSLGQRPAVFLVAPDGSIAASWLGKQQWQIPSVDEILRKVLEQGAD
jgi:peroxiredoxin